MSFEQKHQNTLQETEIWNGQSDDNLLSGLEASVIGAMFLWLSGNGKLKPGLIYLTMIFLCNVICCLFNIFLRYYPNINNM